LFALNGGQALIIASAMTAMLILAALEVQAGTMTIGDFVLINAFTMQIFMPLNFLGFVYREIRGALANIENLFTLLKTKVGVEDTSMLSRSLLHKAIFVLNRSIFIMKKIDTSSKISHLRYLQVQKSRSSVPVAVVNPP